MFICPDCRSVYEGQESSCPRDGAPLAEVLAHQTRTRYPLLDKVVGDRYHLIGGLGKGGLGTVYLARHRHLDQLFAVKFLDLEGMGPEADTAQRATFRRDFLKEARVASVIRHPAVVRVSDFGEYAEMPFLVMEYVPGPSLLSVIANQGRLEVAEACNIARRIAEALDAFHERRLVHRDVKPANVILDPRSNGQLTLVDLGMVKDLSGPGGKASTHPLALRGTPGYLAPEQVPAWVLSGAGIKRPGDKQPVDARVDLYALGVIFYEMLAGVSPYPDGSNTQIIVWTCTRDPIPLAAVRPPLDLPPGLEALVEDTMARDPGRRPASAAAFLARLAAVGRGDAIDTSWPALDPVALSASVANLNAPLEVPRVDRAPSSPSVPAVGAQAPGPFVATLAPDAAPRVQGRNSALESGERVLLAPPSARGSLLDEDATVDADADSLEGLLGGLEAFDDESALTEGGPTARPRPRRPEPASISRIPSDPPPARRPDRDAGIRPDPRGAGPNLGGRGAHPGGHAAQRAEDLATAINVDPGAGPTLATPGLNAENLARAGGGNRVSDAVRHVVRVATQAELDAADESTVAFADIAPPPLDGPRARRSRMLWAAPLAAAVGVGGALWFGARGGATDVSTPPGPESVASAPVRLGNGAGSPTSGAPHLATPAIPGAEHAPVSAVPASAAPLVVPASLAATAPASLAPATPVSEAAPATPATEAAPARVAPSAPPTRVEVTAPSRAPATRAARPPATPATEPPLVVRPARPSEAAEAGASLARADQAMRAGDYARALTEYRAFQRKADARTRQLHPEVDDRIRWLQQQVRP